MDLKHNFFLRGYFNNRGYEDSAKLTEDAITSLPHSPSLARYSFDAGKVFDKASSAKIAHGKVLADAGRALESTPFGLAVVVARRGMTGDADDMRVLTQAQAMTVRDYLVANFKMDDTRVKTLGLGKDQQVPADAGSIEVLIYPPGVRVPAAAARR